ncbi:speckle-type poz protein [Anaeramoeba ignava]|uniref:Speckle-type poz protein n=1 Tax=Anaeramoeba ignava TaxID=1746090 RepID=A0A9Q0LYM0_ANAIG|nr:speckle-type poz protein [Anaeramoeba ignava]
MFFELLARSEPQIQENQTRELSLNPFFKAIDQKVDPKTFELICEENIEIINEPYNSKTYPIQYVLLHASDPELVRILCEKGAILDNEEDTINTIIVSRYFSKENLLALLEYDPELPEKENFLVELAKQREFVLFKELCKRGADVHSREYNTPLHYITSRDLPIKFAEVVLKYGADPTITNKETPIEYCLNEDMKRLLNYYQSITEDMLNLLKRQELTDLEFKTKDGVIKVHEIIIKTRIGENKVGSFKNFLLKIPTEDAMDYLKIIYAGFFNEDVDYPNFEEFEELFEDGVGNILSRKGIINDLKKLYKNESLKNFTIYVGEKEFKIHKEILLARSDLYRGMFLNIKDDSNCVHDYSGKSYETLNQVIKFLYLDKIDSNISDLVLEELDDCVDYYQLNINSMMTFFLNKAKKKKNLLVLN